MTRCTILETTHTDRHTDRQTDRETERQTDLESDVSSDDAFSRWVVRYFKLNRVRQLTAVRRHLMTS